MIKVGAIITIVINQSWYSLQAPNTSEEIDVRVVHLKTLLWFFSLAKFGYRSLVFKLCPILMCIGREAVWQGGDLFTTAYIQLGIGKNSFGSLKSDRR